MVQAGHIRRLYVSIVAKLLEIYRQFRATPGNTAQRAQARRQVYIVTLDLAPRLRLSSLALSVLLAFPAGIAQAQMFFGDLGDGVTVGVDQGSTALLPEVDTTTRYLSFDTYGTASIGPDIATASIARPDLLARSDQVDAVALLAGAIESGPTEVLAAGLGYRMPLGAGGLSWFVNIDHAQVVLGGQVNRALDLRGDRSNAALGLRQTWTTATGTRMRATLELRARRARGDLLGIRVLDEDLRILQASLLGESGVPFGLRTRFGASVAQGLDALGASGRSNPTASLPGASSSFLRLSLAGEVSLPVSARMVVNAGMALQWADRSLPLSERCGYATNAYSRGFDQTVANGDRCVAARVELARYLAMPATDRPDGLLLQGFAGLDGGQVRNLGNAVVAAQTQGWSSLSVGLRGLRGDGIAEIAATRILDDLRTDVSQDTTRLWLRAGYRF